jgi:hypothetical protein
MNIKLIVKIVVISQFVLSCSSQPKLNIAEREPAAKKSGKAGKSECADIISSFYQSQSLERIESRIAATKGDPHKFYRSFPPLYFKILEDLGIEGEFAELYKVKGVIGGDVHVENFGVRKFKGELKLLINDFDDITEGPVFADVLRLLTSMKLAGANVDKDFVKGFLVRYQEGLSGAPENYSNATKKFFKESEEAPRLNPKKASIKTKKFLEKREPAFDMTDDEIKNWKSLMKDVGVVVDQYKYVKESGGSGGLDRFELLVELKSGELVWLEAKHWDTAGYNAAISGKAPSTATRLKHVLKYDQPEIPISVKQYDKKPFLIREINDSHVGLTIDDFNKKDLVQVYYDEAYALGYFHRVHQVPAVYQSQLQQVKPKDIADFVEKIKDEIKDFVK